MTSSASWELVLGVWKIKTQSCPVTDDYFTNTTNNEGDYEWGYAFDLGWGQKINPTGDSAGGGQYAKKCAQGDIIEVVLNLDAFTIKYNINNEDYGIMQQVENTEYRIAVASYNNVSGSSIKMLSDCLYLK